MPEKAREITEKEKFLHGHHHCVLKIPNRKDIGPTTMPIFKTFPCKNGLAVPRGKKLVKVVDINVKVLKLYFFHEYQGHL